MERKEQTTLHTRHTSNASTGSHTQPLTSTTHSHQRQALSLPHKQHTRTSSPHHHTKTHTVPSNPRQKHHRGRPRPVLARQQCICPCCGSRRCCRLAAAAARVNPHQKKRNSCACGAESGTLSIKPAREHSVVPFRTRALSWALPGAPPAARRTADCVWRHSERVRTQGQSTW